MENLVKNTEEKLASSKIQKHDTFNILLIEEDNSIGQKMMPLINSMNFRVDYAANCLKATKLAHQTSYNLVILDITQHTDEKLDLIQVLKQHHPNLDFVTITGHNSKSIETKVRELRVLYHLVKPFSTNEFSSVLKHISKQFRK